MWPLCDFTAENGGTVLVPGSQRWGNEFPGPDTPKITIEMPAGSLLIYSGSLWHGGGANHTDQPRLGVVLHYSASWLRPVENHVLAVPPARRTRAARTPAGAPRLQHPAAVHRLRRRPAPEEAPGALIRYDAGAGAVTGGAAVAAKPPRYASSRLPR